jgi:hypothetical protein
MMISEVYKSTDAITKDPFVSYTSICVEMLPDGVFGIES